MDKAISRTIRSWPFFTFLLPVFFVAHGLSEYLYFIPFSSALKLLFFYLALVTVLLVGFYFIFHSFTKAALASFFSLSIFFFFGFIHDSLKKIAEDSFLVKYSFLLPFLSIIYVFVLIRLKKSFNFKKVILYLNCLFSFLILFDISVIAFKVLTEKKDSEPIAKCENCPKPDVYLIVLDGYAGQSQLSDDFSYNNKVFFDSLQQMKFHIIPQSRSNYSSTVFSISSLLNMDYLELKEFSITDQNLNYCYKQISQNRVVALFEKLGYQIINNSIFDIGNNVSLTKKTFLVSGTDLISSQTLWARIKRDLYNNFIIQHMQGSQQYRNFVFRDLENNNLLYDKTINYAALANNPKFVYTHLMMPHFPYYYTEDGKLNKLLDLRYDKIKRKDLYIGYLKFCNKKVLSLITSIKQASKKEAVIMVLSDHGYRYVSNKKNYFSNLAAIYLPNKNYKLYYDTLTNVNQFRVLFNTCFNQSFPILNDKIIK
jgi:hypothetical protein